MGKRFSVLLIAILFLFSFISITNGADPKKKVKVAFALLWTIHDMGWTTAHYRGIQYLKKQLGDKIIVSYTENVHADNGEQVLRAYARKHYDIIFATTYELMDPCLMVAKDFPNIKFEHCSGYKKAKNMGNYFARMYQADYLAGYMAGLMGFKNVGTVATQPIPEPIRGINAFTLGLIKGLKEAGHSFNPKKVNTIVWLKKWYDPINETVLAETLINRGHDLIRQMADTPDSSRTACYKKVPCIGYGTDVTKYGATCALVSTEWAWGPYYVETVKSVINGTWKPREYWGGFDKSNVKLSPFHPSVPENVRKKVLKELEKLKRGEDNIFKGPIKNQKGEIVIPAGKKATDKDLLIMRWLVEGVAGKIPD
ncbi:MAG: BMP family ABC transporter substrate-binding protein [Deltaproteobacteria bacterium]|nr:BMP family ABC transporter substrate-binding protein [Deltaproteobacteria bacterium]RLA91430.1 MAG: BMP family ABC transporter substrate-binding protein [Deltaproteobacteria bacterium]